MKKFTIISTIVLIFAVALPSFANFDKFNIDGREVKIKYQHSGRRLEVSGGVFGGKSCNQLNIDIFFRNSEEDGIAHVVSAIKKYKPRGRQFEGSDKIYTKKTNRRGWFVSDIYLKCM